MTQAMHDAPARLITISGTFVAPDNRPVAGLKLQLRTRKYTNRLLQNETITCITGHKGEYSFSVLPGDYEASCFFIPEEKAQVLGVIHLEPWAPDGTLNDYLGLTASMTYPPSIMIKIIEWVDLAEYYANEAKKAAEQAGFHWQPDGYHDDITYQPNDALQYNGSGYVCIAESTGNLPDESDSVYWNLFAARGLDGETGPQGPKGDTGATGAQGPQGETGATGPKGDTGAAGADGESAYQIWLDAGNTGTEEDFLASLKGPQGDTGPQGPQGETGPQGPQGETGADGAQGPQGETGATGPKGDTGAAGADGESAYQIWLDAGNTGTEDDFLASLKGPQGDTGPQGPQGETGTEGAQGPQGETGATGPKGDTGVAGADGESAYQIWLDAGNTGTEEDFLASLQGPQGDVGPEGPQGVPGDVPEGTVVYKGTWTSGTTYVENDLVTATVNGIAGDYVCLVESTTASLTDTSVWRRIAGTASAIDGVSADSKGNIAYNRSVDVSTATITPQCNGEQNWILNISASATVDLSTFTNPLYNTNPAAALQLYIDTTESGAITVTFTNSDNYWLPDGTYSTDAPVFNLDSTQPMTRIEVTNVTVSGAPGVMVRQVYPVASSGGGVQTVNGIGPDDTGNVETGDYGPDNPPPVFVADFNQPGTMGLFAYKNSQVPSLNPDETTTGSSLKYAGLTNSVSGYSILQYANNSPPGTWVIRGTVGAAVDSTASASFFIRIDGTSLMLTSHLLEAITASDRIRKCRYSAEDNSMIDCEVLVGGKWYPFTASPMDNTTWGPAIYNAAIAGRFGDIEAYS